MEINLRSEINRRAHLLALILEPVLAGLIQEKVRAMLETGASPADASAFIKKLALPKLSSLDDLLR